MCVRVNAFSGSFSRGHGEREEEKEKRVRRRRSAVPCDSLGFTHTHATARTLPSMESSRRTGSVGGSEEGLQTRRGEAEKELSTQVYGKQNERRARGGRSGRTSRCRRWGGAVPALLYTHARTHKEALFTAVSRVYYTVRVCAQSKQRGRWRERHTEREEKKRKKRRETNALAHRSAHRETPTHTRVCTARAGSTLTYL